MAPDTGVLSLSNKRRQGMKLSYKLNVSVSDGVFTNTAQVRQLHSSYNLVMSTDLLFFNLCSVYIQQAEWPSLATPRFKFVTHICSCPVQLLFATTGC